MMVRRKERENISLVAVGPGRIQMCRVDSTGSSELVAVIFCADSGWNRYDDRLVMRPHLNDRYVLQRRLAQDVAGGYD